MLLAAASLKPPGRRRSETRRRRNLGLEFDDRCVSLLDLERKDGV